MCVVWNYIWIEVVFYNSSWWGWDGGAQVHAGGGDSVEESVHGGPQCKEYAGGGSIQLGEVHLCCGLFTGLVGGCRGNSKPAGKHKEGMIPIPNIETCSILCFVAKHPLVNFIWGIWYVKQNSWNIKWSYWFLLSHYHCYLKFTSPSRIRQLIIRFVMACFFFLFFLELVLTTLFLCSSPFVSLCLCVYLVLRISLSLSARSFLRISATG